MHSVQHGAQAKPHLAACLMTAAPVSKVLGSLCFLPDLVIWLPGTGLGLRCLLCVLAWATRGAPVTCAPAALLACCAAEDTILSMELPLKLPEGLEHTVVTGESTAILKVDI